VNPLALLVLLVGGLVLGGAAFATHRFQVKRNAEALLAQADQAEEEGRPALAADYVRQYLGLAPGDKGALARYALLSEKEARGDRGKVWVLSLCEQVLRRDPTRSDVRKAAARLALETGFVKEARVHLKELLGKSPSDVELLLQRARCEALAREFETAAGFYVQVVERTPTDLAAWREYLGVLDQGPGDRSRAAAVVKDMIAANPGSAAARVVAARYHLRTGDVTEADKHLGQGMKLMDSRSFRKDQATDEELLLLAAQVASARGKTAQALKHVRRGLGLHPASATLRLAGARLEAGAGRTARAKELLAPLRRFLPGRVEQRWELGNLLIHLGETTGAREVMRKLTGPEAEWARGLLEAQLLLKNNELGQARRQLEKLRSVTMPPEVGRPVDLMLAECYLGLGSPDQAAAAARRVKDADSQNLAGRARLAEALVAGGKAEEALQEYRWLAARDPAQRVRLGRLLLGRQLRLPERERDWKELETILDAVPADRRQDVEVVMLRAEVLWAQGKRDQAPNLAKEVCKRAPRETEPWLFLAEVAGRKSGQAYLDVLEKAEHEAGRRVEWALARVRHWAGVADEGARKRLQSLAGNLGRWSEDDHERLSISLGLALAQVGDEARAERLWRESARRRPRNLTSRLLLLEAAAMHDRVDEARRLAGEIDQWEGGGGPLGCYARAVVEWRGGRAVGGAVGEARRYLNQAAALRPSWSRVYALLGDIDAQENRREEAVRKYQAAIDRGDVRLRVWRGLAQLLFELDRYGEAVALLRRVPQQDRLKGRLGQLSARLTLVDPDEAAPQARGRQALEVARKVVEGGPARYQDYLWLGQLAWMAGNPKAAEDALRVAQKMAPGEPSTWVALVALLAQVDREKARLEVAKAEKALKGGRHALALMACQEAVGQDSQAEKSASAAVRAQPGKPEVLAEVAAFHARKGRTDQAEQLCRQVLQPGSGAKDAVVLAARRMLAVLLGHKGGYRAYLEGLALIEMNLAGGNAAEDRRIKALLLATQPAQRAEAIRLFESLSLLGPTTHPLMLLLLARLYELDDRWPQARACLQALARGEDRNPRYICLAVLALLRHGEHEEGRRLYEKLDGAARRTPGPIEAHARLLHAEGEKAQAVNVLVRYAEEKAELLVPVALVLESLGAEAEDAAEKLLRRLAADPKHPEGLVYLARHLARRRPEEALRLCERAWGRAKDEQVAVVSLFVLRSGPVTDRQRGQAMEKVRAALKQNRNSVGLVLTLAEMENLAGRYDQAIALYRQALGLEQGNLVALNNLAFLLVLKEGKGKSAEAVKLLGQALEAAGPLPELLDTRGLSHLAAGRAEQAVKDCRAAVKQNPTPGGYFHLAQAQHAAGETRAARETLLRGRKRGLKEEVLHALERPAFRKLSSELEVQ
jgi:tetratricopeptide (TPR) repeat protein